MLRHTLAWLIYIVAFLVLAIILLAFFFDWDWLRHPIEHEVTEKTGRTLAINGNLNVELGWPLTKIQVAGVTFANPAWAKQPLMFTIRRMEVDINLPQVFKGYFGVSTVKLEQPQVFLEQSLDGRKNWLLDRNQKDENAQVKIDRVVLDNGYISYIEPISNTHIQATLSTRQTTSHGVTSADIVFAAQGVYKGLPLMASGSGGTVLALSDETTPYPLNIKATLGQTRLQAAGAVTSLTRFSTIDLNMTLSGPSLDQLYPLIGIALPRTPVYLTQGRLLHHALQWRYEKFTGRIGDSDIAGDMQVDSGEKRPFLRGNLAFQLLNLEDLESPVGMRNQNKGKALTPKPVNLAQPTTPAQSVTATNKRNVLPDLPFRTERWNSVDADVKILAKRIQRARALPIKNLETRLQMSNSVLTLDPLKFGVAGGTLAGFIMLDGQHDPIRAKLNIRARRILLNQLFPTIELTKTSIGQLNGDFNLTGTGNAVNQMLASADGKVILLVDGGKISKLMMETIGLHLWEMLQLKVTGDKVIELNCAVTDFDVKQGIMKTKVMVLDTPVTTIIGSGDINMAQETLNLDLQPHTKVFSPLALHSPIYIRGKFSEPEVSLDKTKLVLRSTGALILGVINPFLAIIPLVDTGPGKNSECGRLIYEAKH